MRSRVRPSGSGGTSTLPLPFELQQWYGMCFGVHHEGHSVMEWEPLGHVAVPPFTVERLRHMPALLLTFTPLEFKRVVA